jgi:hypothetical protein
LWFEKVREKSTGKCFITSCTRKANHWYFKRCGLKKYRQKVRENVLYHQPVKSQEKWTNQKVGCKKKQPITTIVITDFSYINPWLIPSSFLPNSYDVLLREMQQTDYRDEKPDQASKDPSAVNRVLYLWCMWNRFWQRRCQKQRYENPRRFFTHIFMWGMRQRVQPSWHHKQIWSGPQLQLDLRSMRSILQQNGQPSTPSCPAWETRGQADYRWRYQQHLNQDPTQSSDVPRYHHQRPIELQPTRKFYLPIPRPEPCIDNIESIRSEEATCNVSKTGTTLPYMRRVRPPFQRWYGPSTDSRPQPSRPTCLLVLSYGTSRLECCSITILARTTPHQNRRRLGEVFGGVEPTWHPGIHPATVTQYQVGRSSADQRDLLPKQVDPTSHWCQSRPSRLFLWHQGLVCLVGGANAPYTDNLCFFRWLAVHRGAPVKDVEVPAKTYYRQYLQYR